MFGKNLDTHLNMIIMRLTMALANNVTAPGWQVLAQRQKQQAEDNKR
jgi:hypothetical protein